MTHLNGLKQKWVEQIKEKIETHKELSHRFFRKHIIYGLIPIILPIIFGSIVELNPDEDKNKSISIIGFAVTSIVSGVYRFLDFRTESVRQEMAYVNYSNLLNLINNDIENQIEIKVIENELKNLNKFSPRSDTFCCCICN